MYYIDSENFGNNFFLQGLAYSDQCLVHNTGGLIKFIDAGGDPSDLRYGSFIIVYPANKKSLIVRTDESGTELVFFYRKENFWALSNSFLLLSENLSKRGYFLSVNKSYLGGLFIRSSFYEQPREQLAFNEISLLGRQQRIVVTKNDLIVEDVSKKFQDVSVFSKANPKVDFDKSLKKFLSRTRGLLKALSGKHDLYAELSGGVDSRVLCGIFKQEIIDGSIKLVSNKKKNEDFAVANIVAKLLNSSITSPFKPPGKKSDAYSYKIFKYANIGVSTTKKRPTQIVESANKILRINGAGGEVSKPFYNSNINSYVRAIDKSIISDSYKEECYSEIEIMKKTHKYEDSPTQAMANIYDSYRGRFFAGRAWYRNINEIKLSPFNDVTYKELLDGEGAEDFFGATHDEILEKNLLQLLLLLIFDENLAYLIFDKVEKNFKIEDILKIKYLASSVKLEQDDEFCYYFDKSELGNEYPCHESEGVKKGIDALIYEDIEKGMSHVERSNIFSESTLKDVVRKLNDRSLDDYVKTGLLHASIVLSLASDSS